MLQIYQFIIKLKPLILTNIFTRLSVSVYLLFDNKEQMK